MCKGKLLRCILAAGMSAVLAAAPVSALAAETEPAAGLEEAVEEAVEDLSGSAMEAAINVEFGEGLYNKTAEEGTDLTWLQGVSGDAKVVPGEESLDGEFSVSLNSTQLCHALVSVDSASGMVYLSIPEYFDQAVAINTKQLVQGIMSGSFGSEEDNSLNGQIIKMISGYVLQIAGQVQELASSLPAEVWQQEAMNYLTPILSNIVQETTEETITVGELSADVQTQTMAIPSEKMGEIITGTLNSLSQDQVVETILQSDAVSSICQLVSMATGGSMQISGSQLLDQYRAALDGVAAGDYSGFPGIIVRTSSSPDGNAAGFGLGLESGGTAYDLITFKAIAEGEQHAYEITPGAMLLSMIGMDAAGEVDILGQGSTAGGMLNEEADLLVNGESVAKLTITDMDLEAAQYGYTIGTFRFETTDVSVDIIYGVEDDGTRTVEYRYNDELFYHASVYVGPADNEEIDRIDKESAVEIASVNALKDWIGSFNTENALSLLAQAGVPMEAEEPAA